MPLEYVAQSVSDVVAVPPTFNSSMEVLSEQFMQTGHAL